MKRTAYEFANQGLEEALEGMRVDDHYGPAYKKDPRWTTIFALVKIIDKLEDLNITLQDIKLELIK